MFQPRLTLSSKTVVSVFLINRLYSWYVINLASFVVFVLATQSKEGLNLRIDDVGPDIVNVSWNGENFLKNGVNQIRLVAEPSRMPAFIGYTIVNTSASKGSIGTNLTPSTKYMIYVEELTKANKFHIIHYITTKKGGKWKHLRLEKLYVNHNNIYFML